jgi:AcrR family transcriptional regulator
MAAVARASGAPSGSVYHRFAGRGAMLGHVWLRTTSQFQSGFLVALATDPALEGCVAAARFVVSWSRLHATEARILLRGPTDFAPAAWPEDVCEGVITKRAALQNALRDAAARLGDRSSPAVERVVVATIDVPSALVRRHHESPAGTIPRRADQLVEETARALLA